MPPGRSAKPAPHTTTGADSETTERPDPRLLQGHFDRLEEIADTLGAPDTPLDQGLKLYAEGVELLRKTKAIIEEARRQIQQLDEDAQGNPIVLPWDNNADDDTDSDTGDTDADADDKDDR